MTVLIGLLLHGLVVLPLLLFLTTRRNPYKYGAAVMQALVTAFATSSSSATLPVTIESVQKAGMPPATTRFVLSLGSTINMDGTALYESVAAIFIAQSYGIPVTVSSALIIAITSVLASVGAAGIPEAGLVTMILVLRAADLPIEGIALILPIDWLLDRCRTVINVWGDILVTSIVDHKFPAPPAQ